MELYSPGINSGESTGNSFSNYIQDYNNSVGAWTYVTFDSGTSTTFPCGQATNCAMDPCSDFANGFCLHWSRASGYDWGDWKPS